MCVRCIAPNITPVSRLIKTPKRGERRKAAPPRSLVAWSVGGQDICWEHLQINYSPCTSSIFVPPSPHRSFRQPRETFLWQKTSCDSQNSDYLYILLTYFQIHLAPLAWNGCSRLGGEAAHGPASYRTHGNTMHGFSGVPAHGPCPR